MLIIFSIFFSFLKDDKNIGESSFEIEKQFDISLETKFDKVYILEEFKMNLYQLK